MELQEADACYSCLNFRLEKWTCWGKCALHPEFDCYFHTVCNDFEFRDKEPMKLIGGSNE